MSIPDNRIGCPREKGAVLQIGEARRSKGHSGLNFVLMRIAQAGSSQEIEQARVLFKEYEAGLGISLCFQNFDQEVAELLGDYAPPSGRLLLASVDDQIAGCVALRNMGNGTCEMKRLYLRPSVRGKGRGRKLAQAIIDEARQLGYQRMCLDTLPGKMDRALALYRSLGFKEIPPYYDNPVPGATFMELLL